MNGLRIAVEHRRQRLFSLMILLILLTVSRAATMEGGKGGANSLGSGHGRSGGSMTLSLRSRNALHRVGEVINLEVFASTRERILDAPFRLVFDPAKLQFLSATPGNFLKRDGTELVFLANGVTHPGSVEIGIGRSNRARGISGNAVLCRVKLKVISPGSAEVTIAQASAWSDRHDEVAVKMATLRILTR